MQPVHSLLFYVKDPLASANFYTKILGHGPVEVSPGFAMFQLNDGTMIGLWNRDGVKPQPTGAGGASEIGFHVESNGEVDKWHKDWTQKDATILQPPTQMDFGYTFTAADPDGHRLRVFAPM